MCIGFPLRWVHYIKSIIEFLYYYTIEMSIIFPKNLICLSFNKELIIFKMCRIYLFWNGKNEPHIEQNLHDIP